MSYFLQNLINRHQEQGVSPEVSRKVQPRPKAIFETDSGPGSFAQNDLGNSNDITQATSSDSDTGSSMTHYNQDAKPAIQPDSSHGIDDLKERIAAVTLQLGQKSPVLETPVNATENKSYQQAEEQPELPEIAKQSNSQNLSSIGELNIAKPAVQPDSNHRIDDLKERIAAVTLQLGQKSPVLETPVSTTENKSHQQAEDQPELPEIAKQSNSQNLSSTSELNIAKPAIQPDSSHGIDDLKERIATVTLQLGQKLPALETPINATENKSHQQAEDQPKLPKIAKQSNSQNLSSTVELNIDKPAIQPDSSHGIDDLKERIAAVTLQLGQKSPVLETPINSTGNNSHQQAGDQSELPEIAKQSNSQNAPITGELNQSMQTIQHSLNRRQPQQTDNQREVASRREPKLSDTGSNIPVESVQLPLMPKTTSDFAQPSAKVKKQSMESRSEQRESHQSGLLQIPNWLTEMQAGLNNRWREINTKAEPEPVINVTIGRVEVRAVQTDSAKQPKARNKPSGVMSLDDYLKQREHGGQA